MSTKRSLNCNEKKHEELPTQSLARPDSPTLGFAPNCKTVNGLNDVKFKYTLSDLSTIKSRVALYRLSQMLDKEREAERAAQEEPSAFINDEDKAKFDGHLNHPELRTILVRRKAGATLDYMKAKTEHYDKLRHTLQKLDEAFERRDSQELTRIIAKYDNPVQLKFKVQAHCRTPDRLWELTKVYISRVLIPNNWKFRAAPSLADYTALDNYGMHNQPHVHATAQLSRIVEDDGESEERVKKTRRLGESPRPGSDGDSTITETVKGKGKEGQKVRSTERSYSAERNQRNSGRMDGLAKKWR